MNTRKNKWDPFRLISDKEFYDNLESMNAFNRQIRLKQNGKREHQTKAA